MKTAAAGFRQRRLSSQFSPPGAAGSPETCLRRAADGLVPRPPRRPRPAFSGAHPAAELSHRVDVCPPASRAYRTCGILRERLMAGYFWKTAAL